MCPCIVCQVHLVHIFHRLKKAFLDFRPASFCPRSTSLSVGKLHLPTSTWCSFELPTFSCPPFLALCCHFSILSVVQKNMSHSVSHLHTFSYNCCTRNSTQESLDSDSDSEKGTSATPPAQYPASYHTVTFKCIGCHKEVQYQQALVCASQHRNNGKVVPHRLECETNNPYDSKAIAFYCKLNK